MLLTAVLAAVTLAPAWGLTVTLNSSEVTIDTRETYEGDSLDYSNGRLTYKWTPDKVDFKFTLDYDAFNALESNASLILADRAADGKDWGLMATADAQIKGNDRGGLYTNASDTIMSAEDLSSCVTTVTTGEGDAAATSRVISDMHVVIDGTATNGTGTRLQTSSGEDVYYSTGLRYTTCTFAGATINTNLVKSFTITDYESYTVSAGDVSKTLIYGDTAVLTDSDPKTEAIDKYTVLAGDAMLLDGVDANEQKIEKSIVVGSATQLFLQTWKNGGNPDALNVERDIYIGSSTYSGEDLNANPSAVKYHNAALRFGNDTTAAGGNVTNISGNVYIVEDAKMISGSTNAINFIGNVTDVVDGF